MTTIRKISRPWLVIGPLFIIIGAALWGTESYFRIFLNTKFDEEVLVFHEHLFCLVFALPIGLIGINKIKNVSRKAWIYLIFSGVLGSAIGTTFFTMSLNVLNPSVANVLLNFQPLITVTFASVLLNERLGAKFFLWSAVALAAGLAIASDGFKIPSINFNLGIIYVSIAALAWGCSTAAGRGAMLEIPLRQATAGRFLIGALALMISLLFKGKFTPEIMKWHQLAEVVVIKNYLWLSVVGGVIPLFFFFKGLAKTPASVAGFCELTQTFSALLLTWGIMGNRLTMLQAISGIILLGAVFMINFNAGKANQSLPSSL